jgi:pyruvate dehydrogenase kinase 2/3/4
VLSWYRTSFDDIRSHPLPKDVDSESSFTRLLASIYERHSPTVVTMARGLVELRRAMKMGPRDPLPEGLATPLQQWLDIFFLARLGVRTLIAQHIAMHEPREGYVGIINPHCSPYDIITSAAEDAREVCLRNYPDLPEVKVTGDTGLTFPYVPLMLRHVVFELLKNSMRATVERHGQGGMAELPPVEVVIASSDESEDVAIKIADRGGGISRKGMKRIFTYLYTTAQAPVDLEEDRTGPASPDFSTRAPMAGLGFGIPLSRVYARYFGGDLHILSMQGYGTDAYIYTRRLGDASEPLSEASPTISGFARALARGKDSHNAFTTLQGREGVAGNQAGQPGEGSSPPPVPRPGSGSGDVWAGRGAHASFKVNIRSAEPTGPEPGS